jgi:hypothetical protein
VPHEINGLPAHVLLIHAVVILIPVAALLLVAQAWSRAARRWAGIGGPLLCLAALVVVPITTNAGYWLRDHLRVTTPLIQRHAHLGRQLLPWVAGMFVLSVAVYLVGRRPSEADKAIVLEPTSAGSAKVQLLVAVLATVVAVGSVRQTILIGDSGAQAVWKGVVVTK